MAEAMPGGKKPRIRKTAPSLREKAEAAQAEASKPKSSRLPFKSAGSLGKLKGLKDKTAFVWLAKVTRPVGKVLKWLIPRYFINSWREVRQVTWPTRRETWRLTGAVFVFAIIFGALVAVVDLGLDQFFKKVILK